tara:strand:+ start:1504 stop:1899 length:396 start_codon:yes stop_codon:yes gene_type:complete
MREIKKGNLMRFKIDSKGFVFRSGAVKKTKSYSSFWDNSSDNYSVDEFLGNDVNTPKGKDLVALSGYKRAISNFVNIVTGKIYQLFLIQKKKVILMVRKLLSVLISMIRNLMWLLDLLFTRALTLNFLILI